MKGVVGSETASEGVSAKSRRGWCGSEKSASSAESHPTEERTQTKEQKLKHGTLADLVA